MITLRILVVLCEILSKWCHGQMFSRPIWKEIWKSTKVDGSRRSSGKQADASQKWRGHHDFGNGHSILANFIICSKRPTPTAPKDLWVPMPWLDCVENDQFFSPTKSMSHSGDGHWGEHPQPPMAQWWLLPPGVEHTLVVCNLHRQSGGCCVNMTM